MANAALLLIVGEPLTPGHKDLIIAEVTKGFRCWDESLSGVDINAELAQISDRASAGQDGPEGEKVIRHTSDSILVEVLINPQTQTTKKSLKNFLGTNVTYRHLVFAGHSFQGNGAWLLQDDMFSFSRFTQLFKDTDIESNLKQQESTLNIHCIGEGPWKTQTVNKLDFSKFVKVSVNPEDKLTDVAGVLRFAAYVASFLECKPVTKLLPASDIVGNIRFNKPTIYIFPGCEGDSSLFGINGFNLLVNGGYNRKSCFWDFTCHLDRIDAILLTHMGSDNIFGISSALERKSLENVYPEIGYIYLNAAAKAKHSPEGDDMVTDHGKQADLLVNLSEETNCILEYSRQLGHIPNVCAHAASSVAIEPINLYHKVGQGSLDMYVLSPVKDMKEFKNFVGNLSKTSNSVDSQIDIPVENLLSVSALVVWKPDNPTENITRILFTGNTPQSKILTNLIKLKHLDFFNYPVCCSRFLLQKKAPPPKTQAKRPSSIKTSSAKFSETKIIEKSKSPTKTVKKTIVSVGKESGTENRKLLAEKQKLQSESKSASTDKRKPGSPESKRSPKSQTVAKKTKQPEKEKPAKVKKEKERSPVEAKKQQPVADIGVAVTAPASEVPAPEAEVNTDISPEPLPNPESFDKPSTEEAVLNGNYFDKQEDFGGFDNDIVASHTAQQSAPIENNTDEFVQRDIISESLIDADDIPQPLPDPIEILPNEEIESHKDIHECDVAERDEERIDLPPCNEKYEISEIEASASTTYGEPSEVKLQMEVDESLPFNGAPQLTPDGSSHTGVVSIGRDEREEYENDYSSQIYSEKDASPSVEQPHSDPQDLFDQHTEQGPEDEDGDTYDKYASDVLVDNHVAEDISNEDLEEVNQMSDSEETQSIEEKQETGHEVDKSEESPSMKTDTKEETPNTIENVYEPQLIFESATDSQSEPIQPRASDFVCKPTDVSEFAENIPGPAGVELVPIDILQEFDEIQPESANIHPEPFEGSEPDDIHSESDVQSEPEIQMEHDITPVETAIESDNYLSDNVEQPYEKLDDGRIEVESLIQETSEYEDKSDNYISDNVEQPYEKLDDGRLEVESLIEETSEYEDKSDNYLSDNVEQPYEKLDEGRLEVESLIQETSENDGDKTCDNVEEQYEKQDDGILETESLIQEMSGNDEENTSLEKDMPAIQITENSGDDIPAISQNEYRPKEMVVTYSDTQLSEEDEAMSGSSLPEAFEKDTTPDPNEAVSESDKHQSIIHETEIKTYDTDESKEEKDVANNKGDAFTEIEGRYDEYDDSASDNDDDVRKAGPEGDSYSHSVRLQPGLDGVNPFAAVDQQALEHHQYEEPRYSESLDDGRDQETSDQKSFNALEEWGQPMGLPQPMPSKPLGSGDAPNRANMKQNTEAKRTNKISSTLQANIDRLSTSKPRPASARTERTPTKTSTRSVMSSTTRTTTTSTVKTSGPKITPIFVDLSYIPAHGDPAYSDIEFFKNIRARYYVLSALSPNPQTLSALLDAKKTWEDTDLEVTVIPTYENDNLRHWIALNAEQLNELKIDVVPAASRCTIQLQDHDTNCLAYRLEF